MKTLLKNSILGAVSATVLVSATVQTASAVGTGSTFPGAMCKVVTGTKAKYNKGAIYNKSTSRSMRVLCPIVSSTLSGTGGAWVKVTDRSGGAGAENVRCELYNVYRRDSVSAATTWRSGVEQSTGFGSDVQKLEFDVSSFNENIPSYAESHRYIQCSLPPRTSNTGPSEIHSYSLSQ